MADVSGILNLIKTIDDESTIDYIAKISKQLWYVLNYLDSENIQSITTNVTNIVNGDGDLMTDENGNIFADYIVGDLVVTQALYAQDGYISRLTVDELLTEDKVQRYLATNKAQVDFIHIFDQFTQFKTATYNSLAESGTTTTSITITGHGLSSGDYVLNVTRGEYREVTVIDDDTFTVATVTGQTTGDEIVVQARNRENELLYWTADDFLVTTIEVTAYPVYTYIYTELVKMQLGFEDVDGTQTPVITLGAGTGTGNNGKGFIYKGVDALEQRYFSSVDGSERTQRHTDDDVNHVIGDEVSKNTFTQETEPVGVAEGSVWIPPNDYSIDDHQIFNSAGTVDVAEGRYVDCSGTFTLTLYDLSDELSNGPNPSTAVMVLWIMNTGTGTITVNPDSGETINGGGSISLTSGQWAYLVGYGTDWKAKVW